MSQLASYFGNRNATSTAVGFHASWQQGLHTSICNVALHSIHIYNYRKGDVSIIGDQNSCMYFSVPE